MAKLYKVIIRDHITAMVYPDPGGDLTQGEVEERLASLPKSVRVWGRETLREGSHLIQETPTPMGEEAWVHLASTILGIPFAGKTVEGLIEEARSLGLLDGEEGWDRARFIGRDYGPFPQTASYGRWIRLSDSAEAERLLVVGSIWTAPGAPEVYVPGYIAKNESYYVVEDVNGILYRKKDYAWRAFHAPNVEHVLGGE